MEVTTTFFWKPLSYTTCLKATNFVFNCLSTMGNCTHLYTFWGPEGTHLVCASHTPHYKICYESIQFLLQFLDNLVHLYLAIMCHIIYSFMPFPNSPHILFIHFTLSSPQVYKTLCLILDPLLQNLSLSLDTHFYSFTIWLSNSLQRPNQI